MSDSFYGSEEGFQVIDSPKYGGSTIKIIRGRQMIQFHISKVITDDEDKLIELADNLATIVHERRLARLKLQHAEEKGVPF